MIKHKITKRQKKTVLVNFILDKSGSMLSSATDVIGGFNSYVEQLKEDNNTDYFLSLTLFDTAIKVEYSAQPLEKVKELTASVYRADGMTALNDATAETIKNIEKIKTKYDNNLIIIMTDGEENSSKEYTSKDIKDIIAKKETDGWTFVYLGANVDAWMEGGRIGTQIGNTASWSTADAGAIGTTFSGLACATMYYANTTGAGLAASNFYQGKIDISK